MLPSKARPTLQVSKLVNDSLCAWSRKTSPKQSRPVGSQHSCQLHSCAKLGAPTSRRKYRSHKGKQLVCSYHFTIFNSSISVQLPPCRGWYLGPGCFCWLWFQAGWIPRQLGFPINSLANHVGSEMFISTLHPVPMVEGYSTHPEPRDELPFPLG